MPSPNRKIFGFCPECDSRIRLKNPRLGQQVTCHACDTDLEVVETSPLELDWTFAEGTEFAHEYDDGYDAYSDEFD